MLTEYFVFDGVRSTDAGIQLQSPLSLSGAVPNVKKTTVAGRNGELIRFDGSYENRTISAECFCLQNGANAAIMAINKWLVSQNKYRKFEYTEWPDHYMMARVVAAPNADVRVRLLAPFSLEFDCKPQRFMKTGEQAIRLESPGNLYNYGLSALPFIRVYGTAGGNLTICGKTVQINSINEYLDFDCDVQNAYKGDENMNSTIYAPEFPTLDPGVDPISWDGGITAIEITPRWWTL